MHLFDECSVLMLMALNQNEGSEEGVGIKRIKVACVHSTQFTGPRERHSEHINSTCLCYDTDILLILSQCNVIVTTLISFL